MRISTKSIALIVHIQAVT